MTSPNIESLIGSLEQDLPAEHAISRRTTFCGPKGATAFDATTRLSNAHRSGLVGKHARLISVKTTSFQKLLSAHNKFSKTIV